MKPPDSHGPVETYIPGTPGACLTGSVSPAPSIQGVGTKRVCVALLLSHPHSPCDRRLHPWAVPGSLLRLCESCLLGKCLSLRPPFDSAAGTKVAVGVSEEDQSLHARDSFPTPPFPLPSPPLPSQVFFPSPPFLCHSISLASPDSFQATFYKVYHLPLQFSPSLLSVCGASLVCWILVLPLGFLYLSVLPRSLSLPLGEQEVHQDVVSQ